MLCRAPPAQVEKIRNDKDWFECMNMEDLSEVWNGEQARKKRGASTISQKELLGKKRRPSKRTKRGPAGVMSQFRTADMTGVDLVTKIFENMEVRALARGRELGRSLGADKRVDIIAVAAAATHRARRRSFACFRARTTLATSRSPCWSSSS